MDAGCFSLSHFTSLCSLGDPEIVQLAIMKDVLVPSLLFGGAKNLYAACVRTGDQPSRKSFNLTVMRLCYKSVNDWTVQLIGLYHYFRHFIFVLIHHLFKNDWVCVNCLINYGNIKQLSLFIRKIYLLPLNLYNR